VPGPRGISRGDAELAVLLLFFLATGFAGAGTAQISGRWPPGARIAVWIAEPTERPGDAELVERAMRVWTEAADGKFILARVTDRQAARLRVHFASSGALLGEASPVTDRRTGFITEADIAFASNINGDLLDQQIVIYMTALHELGHALGLRHTAAFEDIMYFFRRPEDPVEYFGAFRRTLESAADIGRPPATGLSEGDLAALRSLYR
jgi:hypothetical protein